MRCFTRFCGHSQNILKKYLDIPSVGAKRPKDALNDFPIAQLTQLDAGGFPWADTALMLCYTGFRVSEFLQLTRFSYHPEDGGYLQGGLKTDAGKNRIVPIHPKIRPYLLAWLEKGGDTIICDSEERLLDPNKFREYFHEVAVRIGAPDATPHWCRHTFATRLHAAKADPLTVKWFLGHSTKSDITAHYTHETIGVLKEAVTRLVTQFSANRCHRPFRLGENFDKVLNLYKYWQKALAFSNGRA